MTMIDEPQNSPEQELLAEIERLRQEVMTLQETNQALKAALALALEQGDGIKAQLYQVNQQLLTEVAERKKAETTLNALLENLAREKSDLEIIVETITEHSDVVETDLLNRAVEASRLATTDDLTQVANRRSFDHYLHQVWGQMYLVQEPVSLIFCDVDYFKLYNDHYGHQGGDHCLRQIAQALKEAITRSTDLVARYGGEEFAVIMPGANVEKALQIAQRIQQQVHGLKLLHGRSSIRPYVTLSLGISSLIPGPTNSVEELITRADQALYQAKQQGRDRYCLSPD